MEGRRGLTCFFILFYCGLFLAGCENSKTTKVSSIKGVNESSQVPEQIKLEEIQKTAQIMQWDTDIVRFEVENPCHFAYDRLSEGEKIWYENINNMLAYRNENPVYLSQEGFENGLGEADIDKIYNCVMLDHPEYFFVEGYEYTKYSVGKETVGISICGKYVLSKAECIQRKQEIEEKVNVILQNAPINGDDYEKIKYIYEYIIRNTEYEMDASDNQNIYSVFAYGKSVCQGYAKAVQLLLNKLGVETVIVYGKVGIQESHSWNMVNSNGKYYYVDATWGDASYIINGKVEAETGVPQINYDYLCVDDGEIRNTHMVEKMIELPECVSKEDNYYVREGCFFYGYDEEQMKIKFENVIQEGKKEITLKSASIRVYDEIYNNLVINQRIFEYWKDASEEIAYIEDRERLTLTFWVTK